MARDEEFQHRQAVTEVRTNWQLDDLTRRIRHQTAHAGQLANLVRRTTGTGGCHHVDGVKFIQPVHQGVCNLFCGAVPNGNDLFFAFGIAQ